MFDYERNGPNFYATKYKKCRLTYMYNKLRELSMSVAGTADYTATGFVNLAKVKIMLIVGLNG